MSYRDCLACEDANTKPKRGKGVEIVFDPRITLPGPPTIGGYRNSAELAADRVRAFGIKSVMRDYQLTREGVLTACWWAGEYGPRRFRKAWGDWARIAAHHLWYGCINITDPPTEEQP